MILRRHNEDCLDEFCCEWCGTWTRLEFLETLLPCGLPERETCPACADAIEEEAREEALAGDQCQPLWIEEQWT